MESGRWLGTEWLSTTLESCSRGRGSTAVEIAKSPSASMWAKVSDLMPHCGAWWRVRSSLSLTFTHRVGCNVDFVKHKLFLEYKEKKKKWNQSSEVIASWKMCIVQIPMWPCHWTDPMFPAGKTLPMMESKCNWGRASFCVSCDEARKFLFQKTGTLSGAWHLN